MRTWQKLAIFIGLAFVTMHTVTLFTFRPQIPITSQCLGCVALMIEKAIVLMVWASVAASGIVYFLTRNRQTSAAKAIKSILAYGNLLLLTLCSLQIAYAYFLVTPKTDYVIPAHLHCLMKLGP